MGLRKRTFISIVTILAVLISAMSYVSFMILSQGFSQIEINRGRLSGERFLEVFNSDLENLSTKLSDWSSWDDTYDYMRDKNPEYEDSNLKVLTLDNLKLNMLVFFNIDGTIAKSVGYDLIEGKENPLSGEMLTMLQQNPHIMVDDEAQTDKKGLIKTPQGLLLYASRPILTSERQGPNRGTLMFAKYFNQSEIQRLSEITKTTIYQFEYQKNTDQYDIDELKKEFTSSSPIVVKPIDANTIASHVLLREVDGHPILVLRLDSPRDIYQLGQKSIKYIIGAFIIIGLFSFLMVFITLERSVLSPISTLKTEIERIQKTGTANDRIKADSLRNEFQTLSVAINSMLTSLEKSDEALRDRTLELEKMNNLMVGRELKMVQLKEKNAILEKERDKGV